MNINFKNGQNFDSIVINIQHQSCDNLKDFFLNQNRNFKFKLVLDGAFYSGEGVRGDDAIWIPMNDYYGVKLITNNPRYGSLEETLENIEFIDSCESDVFPELEWYEKSNSNKNTEYIVCMMENIRPYETSKLSSREINYLPKDDIDFVENVIVNSPSYTEYAAEELIKLGLLPEDEWYKSINFINGKIVDFHRFKKMPQRYALGSNNFSKQEINSTYKKIVDRYKKVLDENNVPKWKGKIYQGFVFDNGSHMSGYSSDNQLYDSYRKLSFIPFNKVKNKKVLDLGSNQGFFCFQAALHGASEITGVELQKEDVLAAKDINKILQFDNINFVEGDANKHVLETKEKYGLVIANSVLHQIYPNLSGADDILDKIASNSEYFSFETPLNHPKMNISVHETYQKLAKYFKTVRLLNIYDAYSSGYRANFVCYS